MYVKFQGQNIHQQKAIQNLPTLVAVENVSLLPTLTASQSLNFIFFAMKFLGKNLFMLITYGKKFKAK
jgi:hypothetical protein